MVAGGEHALRLLLCRLLLEAQSPVHRVIPVAAQQGAALDVTVTGCSKRGRDAQGDQVILLGYVVSCGEQLAKPRLIADVMVRSEHSHHGMWVAALERHRRHTDDGSRAARHGLQKVILRRNLRALLLQLCRLLFHGDHVDMVGRKDAIQPLHRGLEQAALLQETEHLLGARLAREAINGCLHPQP